MSLLSRFQRIFGKAATGRRRRPRPSFRSQKHLFRPTLEILEDRTVPSLIASQLLPLLRASAGAGNSVALLASSARGTPAVTSCANNPFLGNAASFGVLAGQTVTNTGPTVVDGNVGVSPGSAITGFTGPPNGSVTGGTIHGPDALTGLAQHDVTTAYNTLAGLPVTSNLTGQVLGNGVGGTVPTLTPGVYRFNVGAQLTGALTLDFQGNSNALFVFQIGSTLTTASASSVVAINNGGAGTPNVYWQIGSSATLGTTTTFIGSILALTDINLRTGATISCGRALARNGQVTMQTNVVSII
ncbi:MAG TPA: ice-binding family protein [Gemmataceae bacterium]|jgi:type VI secretion system secreted protein VgrG|nr:ice-binding family protein [Gemmataceae bacterium]